MQTDLRRPVPPEDAPLVVFDMDGTICHNKPRLDFMDARAVLNGCRPNPVVIERLRALWESGTCHIAILTARNRSVLGEVTRSQLVQWLGPEVEDTLYAVWDSNIGGMGSIGPKMFWLSVREFKAFHLTNHQATVFIGDTSHDQEAAHVSGVAFMSAWQFANGQRIPGLQPPGDFLSESDEVLDSNRAGDLGA